MNDYNKLYTAECVAQLTAASECLEKAASKAVAAKSDTLHKKIHELRMELWEVMISVIK